MNCLFVYYIGIKKKMEHASETLKIYYYNGKQYPWIK